jgi:hypothetical protein
VADLIRAGLQALHGLVPLAPLRQPARYRNDHSCFAGQHVVNTAAVALAWAPNHQAMQTNGKHRQENKSTADIGPVEAAAGLQLVATSKLAGCCRQGTDRNRMHVVAS